MPQCQVCGKRGLFLKLAGGLCPDCITRAQFQLAEHYRSMNNPISSSTKECNNSYESVGVNTSLHNSDTLAPSTQKHNVTQKATPKTYHVTGIQYYMDNLFHLADTNLDYTLSKREMINEGLVGERIWENDFYPIKTEIIPEPDNPHDPKAIKVVVDGEHVGYIKAGSCSHLLNILRENRIQKITCEISGGPYKYIDEEYSEERNKSIYTLEQGNAPYRINLYITET